MTPTEQDKKLRAEVKQVLKDGFNYYIGERKDVSSDMKPLDIYCTEHLMQLITADRKRVALEARIDEQTHTQADRDGNVEYWPDGVTVMSQLERIATLTKEQSKGDTDNETSAT